MNEKIFKHKWEKVALMILIPCLLLVMFAPCDVFAMTLKGDGFTTTYSYTSNLGGNSIVVMYPTSSGTYSASYIIYTHVGVGAKYEYHTTIYSHTSFSDGNTNDITYPDMTGVVVCQNDEGYAAIGSLSTSCPSPDSITGVDKIVCDDYQQWLDVVNMIEKGDFTLETLEEECGVDVQYDKGSYDNPTIDKNIGRPIISVSGVNAVITDIDNGNAHPSSDACREKVKWKRKTDTGFNLVDSPYAQTYIEVYVESKCKTGALAGHGGKKFINYGEKNFLRRFKASELGCTIDYADIKDALPFTKQESFLYSSPWTEYNYTLWFRVVATNSTAVIPEQAANDWVRGQWVTLDISESDYDKERKTQAYDEDEDGNIKKNDDSDANKDDVNVGPSQGSDEESADDAFDKKIGEKDSNVDMGNWKENAEDLINQIKYIPEMIKAVFSFLPDWCLTLLGCIFTLLLVVIIMKFIRG